MCSLCPSLVTNGLACIVVMICVRIHRSNGLGRNVTCGQGIGANVITSVEGGGGRARANNIHFAYCHNDGSRVTEVAHSSPPGFTALHLLLL
eukprot:COSAG02_NODE_23964_length_702_cov_1.252073_1_plen_91_part_01